MWCGVGPLWSSEYQLGVVCVAVFCLCVSSRMVCAFFEDNGVPISPWTSPSKGWVIFVGGEKNASAVVGTLLLVPPTCIASNEGSISPVVLLASIGARGGRLGTLGSGELHVAVMVKTSTVGPDASLPVVALSVENGTIILLSMLLG